MTSALGSLRPAVSRFWDRNRTGLLLIVFLYLFLSLLTINQIEEDAFIYFRMVDHLAHGEGVVFNAGGERVEAASSLTWLLLLLHGLPFSVITSAKLLGVILGSATLWLVNGLARTIIRDPWLQLSPALLTACSTPFVLCNQRGLETPLFAFLVLWLAWCCVDRRRFRYWPLPAILLLPSRPEGWFFLLALLPALFVQRARAALIVRQVGLVGLAAVILLAARFVYFHDLVPQAFYAKLDSGWWLGWVVLQRYLAAGPIAILYGLPLLLIGWRPSFWTPPRIIFFGVGLVTVTWCVIAKDLMPYMRHLLPAIAMICLLLVSAIDFASSEQIAWSRTLARSYVAILFAATLLFSNCRAAFGPDVLNPMRTSLGGFARRPWSYLRDSVGKVIWPLVPNQLDATPIGQTDDLLATSFQRLVGLFLAANYPPRSLVLYDQMGQTPYYAGRHMTFIDSQGLVDRTVARFYFARRKQGDRLLEQYDSVAWVLVAGAFGEQRRDISVGEVVEYFLGRHPDVVMISTFGLDPHSPAALLIHDARFSAAYQLRYMLAGQILLYDRKDVPRLHPFALPPGLAAVTPQPLSPTVLQTLSQTGRFSGVHDWPVLGVPRG